MSDPWEEARQREIQRISDRIGALAVDWRMPIDEMRAEVGRLDRKRDRLRRHENWLPDRPPRRMPALWAIASFWAAREVFPVDLDLPHCFGCGVTPGCGDDASPKVQWNSAAGWLERAHLVDRSAGGLDGPQNIVPLCGLCHRLMPVFDAGEGPQAIGWVMAGGGLTACRQIVASVLAR